ncbi:hypothetical protein Prudu_21S000100 [Prunus dulcis]|uniref:Ubiquitin-like protease family profile domain-containing protein n=1 Tax=Prunus dulcis TaxID=3755 RepID=A0A5H2XIR7_PRUDU|nr:hypothetical protein Prudu_21S000100 [Prunus dulcis]
MAGCRQKRPAQTLLSPFTDPLRKKRTMTVSAATATPPCFDPSNPCPLKIAEVQLESFSVGADFFYRLVDETEWMSSRHLDMATFLIRKRQLSHPLVFGTDWTTADSISRAVQTTARKRGSKKAAASNTVDLPPSKLKNTSLCAWYVATRVCPSLDKSPEGSHWVAIEIDFVRHTATVYDSYVDFTKRSKLVTLLHPISDTLARVLFDMHFYDDSEVEEVKQKGLTMSMYTPFSVCSIADVPQQRDGASCGILTVKFIEHLSAGIR